MDIDLGGRAALVSGSTQGIGLAIAVELARAGAGVVINGRTAARVDHAVEVVRAEIPDADVGGIAADVTDEAGAATLLAELPHVDILTNNLGIFGARPALEIDDAEWRRFFEVNVLSGVRLTRAYLPGMIARGWGRVQFMGSDSSVAIPAEMIHYGVTKTALLAVARGFAKAAAGTGVTVNTVLAGPTHTEGVEEVVAETVGDELPWDEGQRRFMAQHRPQSLLGRLIEPREIGSMVAYLSSDLASATTGGALRAEGGSIDAILP